MVAAGRIAAAAQVDRDPIRQVAPFARSTYQRRGTVVERRSLAGELSLSCARPAADG